MRTPERWLLFYRLVGGFPLHTVRQPAKAAASSSSSSSSFASPSWVSYEKSGALILWSILVNICLW